MQVELASISCCADDWAITRNVPYQTVMSNFARMMFSSLDSFKGYKQN